MLDDEPVIRKTAYDESGKAFTLDYFILSGLCMTDGATGIPTYGISVRTTADGHNPDYQAVEDITPSKEDIMRLLRLLADNLVTPVTLRDVVEDCLAA